MEERLVAVHRPHDEMEARIVRALLEDNGVPAIINSVNASSVFDGVIAMAEGSWGEILVEEKHAEEARIILDQYEKAADTEEGEAR